MTYTTHTSAELARIRASEAHLLPMIACAALAEDPEAFRVLVHQTRPAIWGHIARVLGNTLITELGAGPESIAARWVFGLERPTQVDPRLTKLPALRAQTRLDLRYVGRGTELQQAAQRLADTSEASLVAGRFDSLLGVPTQKVRRGRYAFPHRALYSSVSSEVANAMTTVEINDGERPTTLLAKNNRHADEAVYMLGGLANDAATQAEFASDLLEDGVIPRDSVFDPGTEDAVHRAVVRQAGLTRVRGDIADMAAAAARLEDVSWNALPPRPISFTRL